MVILDCLYSYVSSLFKIHISSNLEQSPSHVDYQSFNSTYSFSSMTSYYYLPFTNYSLTDINKLYTSDNTSTVIPATATSQDKDNATDTLEIEEFIKILIPILIECWLECSPSTQSISSDQSPKSLQYMKLIAQLIDLLLNYLVSNCSKEVKVELLADLSNHLNKYMFVYFPFTSVSDDLKVLIYIYNISY
jgi:hypothetical protein